MSWRTVVETVLPLAEDVDVSRKSGSKQTEEMSTAGSLVNSGVSNDSTIPWMMSRCPSDITNVKDTDDFGMKKP
jgi:hypothetical protein